MAIELLNRLIMFVALWLAQVLILNRIHLFDVATPLLYVFFVITFRRSSPKWQILLWCFALGLLIDVFSNTPGLAAGTMTLMAVVQPYLLELFVPRDVFYSLYCHGIALLSCVLCLGDIQLLQLGTLAFACRRQCHPDVSIDCSY